MILLIKRKKISSKKGEKANRDMYLVLSQFGIPVDNPQTASALITKLLSLCQLQEKEEENELVRSSLVNFEKNLTI